MIRWPGRKTWLAVGRAKRQGSGSANQCQALGPSIRHQFAKGQTPRGAKPVEIAVPTQAFVDELRKRGFALTEELSFT